MSQYDSPPNPFPDPSAPYAGAVVPDRMPDSYGGPLESTKTAIVLALREALTGSLLPFSDSTIHVDMEYPLEPEHYPGIWVQFSITDMQRAGISHEVMTKTIVNEGEPNEYINWEPIQEWQFNGKVTLTVVALTSLERDRISDYLISTFAFSRPPSLVLTKPTDTKENKTLISRLAENPYISMTINTDQMQPGGQALEQAPFDPDNILVYEDAWSFDLIGYFGIKFRNDGTYTLARLEELPSMAESLEHKAFNPFEWH